MCFSSRDELQAGPAALTVFKDKYLVRDLRWETERYGLSDMSSVFAPLFPNLESFAVLCIWIYGNDKDEIPLSLLSNVNTLKGLRHLELEDFNHFDHSSRASSVNLGADPPHLETFVTGSWWDRQALRFSVHLRSIHYIIDYELEWAEQDEDAALIAYLPNIEHFSFQYYERQPQSQHSPIEIFSDD